MRRTMIRHHLGDVFGGFEVANHSVSSSEPAWPLNTDTPATRTALVWAIDTSARFSTFTCLLVSLEGNPETGHLTARTVDQIFGVQAAPDAFIVCSASKTSLAKDLTHLWCLHLDAPPAPGPCDIVGV